MNKKEVAEIKRNFNDKSGYFTINSILSAFVDGHKDVRYNSVRPTVTMPADEFESLRETLKCVLSSSVGKAFVEYDFPNEQYDEGGSQHILYRLLETKFQDAQATANFTHKIAKDLNYEFSYTIIAAYCTYTVRTKNKNDDYSDDDVIYNFILTAICPAQPGCDGFIFDEQGNEVVKKEHPSTAIAKKPTDGFLYPTFSMRSSDVNHVMYYTKTPKDPNVSMIEKVLGCSYIMTADNEREEFFNVLQNVLGDDLDYAVITAVNEKLTEIVEENKNETEVPTISAPDIKNILSEIGVKSENLLAVDSVYKDSVGENKLTVSNLIDTKTVVTLPDITVNIKKAATDKFRTAKIDGRTVLLIDLDDPYVEINGVPTKMYND